LALSSVLAVDGIVSGGVSMERERIEKLYRQHGASLVRYCAFSAGSWQDGEDIAAEVFSRLIAKGDAIPDQRIAAWLFAVAKNQCASHHRSAARRSLLHRQLAAQSAQAKDPAWVDPSIWRYLRSMKEGARLVVFLHAVEGRPFTQIAELLGKSPSAVKMTHYRALGQVRRAMEADGFTGAASLLGGPNDA
jgi:RNA polymerase sigma factor (sigma-70 family)